MQIVFQIPLVTMFSVLHLMFSLLVTTDLFLETLSFLIIFLGEFT